LRSSLRRCGPHRSLRRRRRTLFIACLAATAIAGLAAGTVSEITERASGHSVAVAVNRDPLQADLLWAAGGFLLVAFVLTAEAVVRRIGHRNRSGPGEVRSQRGTNVSPAVRAVTMPLVAGGRLGLRGLARAPDIDLALALAAFVALLVDPLLLRKITELTPVIGVLAFLTAVPLAARRRFPLGVLAIELPLLMACLAVFHPNRAAVGITMLLVFTVGLEGGRARSLVVGALMAPIVTAAVFITGQGDGPIGLMDLIAYTSLVLGALLAGETLRARQALQRALVEEAAHAREAAAQHRFDQERLALAHELHDIIGHTLVAINVRASAAAHRERKGASTDGPTALDEIASASAGALTELRTALKALRTAQDGPVPLHPFQDLASLADLISGVEDAGLVVHLDVIGTPAALPATVGHAGYRIVQEGLTNVLRHSTARQARVRVEVGDRAVVIEIIDDGQKRATTFPSGGHGLRGMQERAAALGGTCEAGPVNGAGWRVQARIPVDDKGS
jgi:signal transduction histidine kinase